jgi:integrase
LGFYASITSGISKVSLYKQRKSKNWFIRLSDKSGRKIRRSTGTTDRAQAQEFFEREQQRVWRLNKLGDKGARTFREAVARWLKETEKRTKERDRERLGWFLEQKELADDALSSIDIDSIQVLRELCAHEGRSKSTVNRYMAILRAILRKAAFEWKWLEHPPKVPMYKVELAERVWLTHPQFEKLLEELPPHLKLAAEFAVLTGLRMRAMTGLTWDRVDLHAKRAWVPKSGMKGGFTFGLPLNAGALRVLRECKKLFPTGERVFQFEDAKARVLDEGDVRQVARDLALHGRVPYRRLFEELKARYGCRGKTETVMKIWREECGVSREGALALPLEDTAPVRPRAVPTLGRPFDDCNTAAFKKACERAGISKEFDWHGLRHTWASWAAQEGVSLQVLMALGDWRSYSMVLRYLHLCPDNLAEAANLVTRKGHTNRAKNPKISVYRKNSR